MRAAPPCTVRLADTRAERGVVAALHAAAGAVVAAWSLGGGFGGFTGGPVDAAGVSAMWWTLVMALATAGGAVLGWIWGARPLGPDHGAGRWLHWSGRGWHLQDSPTDHTGPPLATLTIAIDAGAWLLLRAGRGDGAGVRWLVARPQAAGPGGWTALRVALAAHAGVPGEAPTQAVG